jgi:hypothetical protein
MKKVLFLVVILIGFARMSPVSAAVTKPRTDSVFVCQSKSSYAYHSHLCSGLKHCKHGIVKMPRAEAIKMGYKACKICY